MKLIFSELILLITKKQERNIWKLIKFFLALIAMVTVYSSLFHFLMIFENREFSWITGLHTAGADLVMSYASMAANTILNLLKPDELLMLAEGLNIFRVVVPPSYVSKSLAESRIRTQTGCNVIAVCVSGATCINPGPSYRFGENNELILIGNGEAESRFFKMHSEMRKIKAA